MLISQLLPAIRAIAEQRREQSSWNYTGDHLIDAFDWELTPEGNPYWGRIYNGHFDEIFCQENDDQIIK